MSKQKLISIIVPFYNVEQCVNYCLNSIIDQTYQDIEIVCIDDGSTDNTSFLLDEFASNDSRIKVYHSENRGLSAARNLGVLHATGELITFIDGDDLVSPYYIEALYEPFENDTVELAVGSFRKISFESALRNDVSWSEKLDYKIVVQNELVAEMLYDRPMISGCAHLAKKEMYENNPFPKGVLFEDSIMFGSHVAFAEKAAIINKPIYGYVYRSGSITDHRKVSVAKISQFTDAIDTLRNTVNGLGELYSDPLRFHIALEMTRLYVMANNAEEREVSKKYCDGAWRWVIKHLWALLGDENIYVKNKIRFILFSIFPKLYPYILRIGKIEYNK